mmetsp:Transcript_18538/g.48123  ORF Transcript_18538/g.48123 Transcript_18538/m.48123 type:complete len:86 (+) Transcript_18538:241-498(+)
MFVVGLVALALALARRTSLQNLLVDASPTQQASVASGAALAAPHFGLPSKCWQMALYASVMPWNFAVASGLPEFLSGWYFSASCR